MKKIIKYYLISLFLLNFSLLAQLQTADSADTNMNKAIPGSISDVPKVQLHLKPYALDKKFFLGEKEYYLPDLNTYMFMELQEEDANPKSLEEMKTELKAYVKMRHNELPNYNLGKFTQYMTYGTTAAAVILAIMHISKYGFK